MRRDILVTKWLGFLHTTFWPKSVLNTRATFGSKSVFNRRVQNIFRPKGGVGKLELLLGGVFARRGHGAPHGVQYSHAYMGTNHGCSTTQYAMEHGAQQKAGTMRCEVNLEKNKQCRESISWTHSSYWHI